MKTARRIALLLLCVPFLLADSCVKPVFVLYEYRLPNCPPPGFELPQLVDFAGWRLEAEEASPYCHGFTRYALDETRSAEAFGEPVKDAFVYARLSPKPGDCRLLVVSSLFCGPREAVSDCESRMPYAGVRRSTRATARDYTDVIAQRLLLGQGRAPKIPADKETLIGRPEALEDWCAKR